MHRMHPVPKLFLLLLFSFLCNLYMDPIILGLVMLVLFWLSGKSKIPWKWYLFPLTITMLSLPLRVLFGGAIWMFDASWYRVYGKFIDVGAILFHITPAGTPIIGETAMSVGSLLYLIQETWKRFIPFQIIYIYLYTTSPSELCNVLAGYGFPNAVMFILTASLRFLTMIQRNTLMVLNAQKLRGFTTKKSRNPIAIFRQYTPLIVPIGRSMHEMTEGVTRAMEVRAFGVRKVSPFKPYATTSKDIAFTVLWVLLTLFMVYILLAYDIGRL
ncbi:MAG: energy-coupling factor transporter transmembrane protein EcfT [Candidatus Bathyarchaeota archaeon]|nr:MAG: energy-coupling factor transporter transmembrane protein EcfT [Candidatus Bathyarchaeota archaeon]